MSKACDSQLSSSCRAALMPPWAAFECERTGWTLLNQADRDAGLGGGERGPLAGESGSDYQYVVLRHLV